MREIKFKFWDDKEKEMILGIYPIASLVEENNNEIPRFAPLKDDWKGQFDINFNLHDTICLCYFPTIKVEQVSEDPDCPHVKLKAFISSLLSSQAHALKERMKACVPKPFQSLSPVSDRPKCFCNDCWVLWNDCREQTLSAIESIEI